MKNPNNLILLLFLQVNLLANIVSFNGQLWSTGYYINQNSSDSSNIGLGYIPEISSSYIIDDNSMIDFEYAHYIFIYSI